MAGVPPSNAPPQSEGDEDVVLSDTSMVSGLEDQDAESVTLANEGAGAEDYGVEEEEEEDEYGDARTHFTRSLISADPDEDYAQLAEEAHAHFLAEQEQRRAEMPAATDGAQVPSIPINPTVKDPCYPRATNEALSALNFIVNRNALADTSLLDGCTRENLRDRIEAMVEGKVAKVDPQQLEQWVRDLQPAVSGSSTAPASSAAAPSSSDATKASDEAPAPKTPAPSATSMTPKEPAPQAPASPAPVPVAPPAAPKQDADADACPIDVDGMIARAAAEAEAPKAKPATTAAPPAAAPALPNGNGPAPMPAAAGPRGLGMGLPGLGAGLPARPQPKAAPQAAPAAAKPAEAPEAKSEETSEETSSSGEAGGSAGERSAGSAMPSLPPRGAMPTLPARPARPARPGNGAGQSTMPPPARPPANPAPVPNPGAARGAAATSMVSAPDTAVANGNGRAAVGAEPEEPADKARLRRRVQDMRVLLLRVARRLGQPDRSSIVQQVLYRLDLAERIKLPVKQRRIAPFDAAVEEAAALESGPGGEAPLPFTCTILTLGLSGVGKTATIRSLLGLPQADVSPFQSATKRVQLLEGTAWGVKLRFIDTPGLLLGAANVAHNARIMAAAKRMHKKYKPDIVMYFDRLDMVRKEQADLPVLKDISAAFGSALWFNATVVLTHASTAPPEGSQGPITHEVFASHRSHLLQQNIRMAAGDMRLLNPVAIVENHPSCRTDAAGEKLLPSGTAWRPHLMILCVSSKLLQDADNVLKMSEGAAGGRGGGGGAGGMMQMFRGTKLPPLPYLVQTLLTPKKPRKFIRGEDKILGLEDIKKLPKERAQEELRKRNEYIAEAKLVEQEDALQRVPELVPPPPLPPTFDTDAGEYRYQHQDTDYDRSTTVVQPVVDNNGIDHEDGVEGVQVEHNFVAARAKGEYFGGVPMWGLVQVRKDKQAFSLQSELEGSYYQSRLHPKADATASLSVQTAGADLLYQSRIEGRCEPQRQNRLTGGLLVSRLTPLEGTGAPIHGPMAYGVKLEDRIKVNDAAKVTLAAGAVTTKTIMGRETAQAANVEGTWKYGGRFDQKEVGASLSAMKFRKETTLGYGLTHAFMPTPETQVSSRLVLNGKGSGTVTSRVVSQDQGALAYSILLPMLGWAWGAFTHKEEEY